MQSTFTVAVILIRGSLRHWRRCVQLAALSMPSPVDLEGHGKHHGDVWTFNGDYETPTFSPSMGFNLRSQEEHHPRCHSFLRDGVWQFLGDCSHTMARQHVPMIPPEPDATFERRHGWHLFPWTDDDGKPKGAN